MTVMLHHARLIKSDNPAEFVVTNNDSEIHYLDHEKLGVTEVKALVVLASRRPIEKVTMTLVVRTTQATFEAQNALLKIFEEPPITTKFVLVVPSALTILPTVLSRVSIEIDAQQHSETAWELFKGANIADRLAQIDSWHKKKDTAWLQQIQNGFRSWLGGGGLPTPALQLVAERLNTRGASNKMLLEALALDSQLQNQP